VRLIGPDDANATKEEVALLVLVTGVLNRYGVGLVGPVQDLAYFDRMLEEYERSSGALDGLEAWLDSEVPKRFRSLKDRPRWIQGCQWPFAGGEPMIFAGQIDVDARRGTEGARHFHDDAALYVFLPALGQPWDPVVVTQTY
jgi:hypothetical protein